MTYNRLAPAGRRDLPRQLRFDGEQFDLEQERRVRPDRQSGSLLPVRQLWGDEQPIGAADRHQLQGLDPPWDDVVQREGRRFPPAVRTVEFRPLESVRWRGLPWPFR
jgi:hypothetical protein